MDLLKELGEVEDEVDPEGLLTEEEITSDLILGPGLQKVKLLYDKVDENYEVRDETSRS